jgi:hypothetical protein
MRDVNEGDSVKIVGNHCYKGREGLVIRVDIIDHIPFIHVSLNGTGDTLIVRPEYYKVTRRGDRKAASLHTVLVEEVMPHIRRIANCPRYSVAVRRETLSRIVQEISFIIESIHDP